MNFGWVTHRIRHCTPPALRPRNVQVFSLIPQASQSPGDRRSGTRRVRRRQRRHARRLPGFDTALPHDGRGANGVRDRPLPRMAPPPVARRRGIAWPKTVRSSPGSRRHTRAPCRFDGLRNYDERSPSSTGATASPDPRRGSRPLRTWPPAPVPVPVGQTDRGVEKVAEDLPRLQRHREADGGQWRPTEGVGPSERSQGALDLAAQLLIRRDGVDRVGSLRLADGCFEHLELGECQPLKGVGHEQGHQRFSIFIRCRFCCRGRRRPEPRLATLGPV